MLKLCRVLLDHYNALKSFNETGSYSLLYGFFGKGPDNLQTTRIFTITVSKNISSSDLTPKNYNDMYKIISGLQVELTKEALTSVNILDKVRAEQKIKSVFNLNDLKGINIEYTDKNTLPYGYTSN